MAQHLPTGAGVYLLHLDPPYKHARHYVGWSVNIRRRINRHKRGTGANLPHVAHKAGSRLILAQFWPGADRTFERWLKDRKCTPGYCPICNPDRYKSQDIEF